MRRHVGRGRGAAAPQILADQKAPPGSCGMLHYYLPPQNFRLCNMPELGSNNIEIVTDLHICKVHIF